MEQLNRYDTIVALATPAGIGALGIIRISGRVALDIVAKLCPGAGIHQMASHRVKLVKVYEGDTVVDEAVLTLFKGPRSFTMEDVVELSLHGSTYILNRVMNLCLQAGARLAAPGEFTFRAFMNGRFDLSQAEAVADLIAADNEHAHRVAMNQMRGGFALEIKQLREELINFASLLELELDFSEEDVEFADRTQLIRLVHRILQVVQQLRSSYLRGNVIKNGVATVIAGKPNAGKSTLLNALLNEEKAIVSPIPGTTRDVIEDVVMMGGVKFRFFDTAGLREATDVIESIGVERTHEKLKQAAVVIYLFDCTQTNPAQLQSEIAGLLQPDTPLLLVGNKLDEVRSPDGLQVLREFRDDILLISAKTGEGLPALEQRLLEVVHAANLHQEKLVANARHEQALGKAENSLEAVENGLKAGISSELVAQEIRRTLYFLGEITGQVSTDDLLGNIFSKFCIGK
jgi:tRNA modification GTPase